MQGLLEREETLEDGVGLEEVGPLDVFFARAQVEVEREGGRVREQRLCGRWVYVSSLDDDGERVADVR